MSKGKTTGDPTLLGQLAVSNRYVARPQIDRAMEEHRAHPDRPLGSILLGRGDITSGQLDGLLGLQETLRRGRPAPIGERAVRAGLLDRAALHRMLDVQQTLREAGRPSPLGRILVGSGTIAPMDLLRLVRESGAEIYACPSCSRVQTLPAGNAADRVCHDCDGPRHPADAREFEAAIEAAHEPVPSPSAPRARRSQVRNRPLLLPLALVTLAACAATTRCAMTRPPGTIDRSGDGSLAIREESFERDLRRADALARDGRPAEARKILADLLETYPQVARIHTLLRTLPQ